MNIRYHLQNINDECKKEIEEYFSVKKINQINRLIKKSEQEIAQLTVRIEYFSRHNAFSTKIELAFGKKVFFSEEQSHDVLKVLDFSIKRLVRQLKK
ncbi:MAG: HPF/RaiA family ribosome-associated protein [Candidatus Pacebacteria bacterium]|nr:HPF/RaiA family ribosome-associated protein [Candidatus Paceibacterota bacterium]